MRAALWTIGDGAALPRVRAFAEEARDVGAISESRGCGGIRRVPSPELARGTDPDEAPRYPGAMRSDRYEHGLELAEVADPQVLDSLARIDSMSDEELRALVRGEHPMVVEAAEALIASRRSPEREAL
jgi:hypothetical protein